MYILIPPSIFLPYILIRRKAFKHLNIYYIVVIMSEKSQEIERLYNLWINSREDKRFLIGWLYSSNPIFKPTIEGISAYMAYRNLPEERRIDYALYSSYLFDLFFTL